MTGRRARSARGELLIEVVLAVAIIGIAVIGLVAAIGTAFRASTRSHTNGLGDLLLARYAEALAAVPYEACHAGTVPYEGAAVSAIPSGGLPAGVGVGPWDSGDGTTQTFEIAVESTAYWNGDTQPATFVPECSGIDHGSELLHLRVRSGNGRFDRRLTLVKRAACWCAPSRPNLVSR